MRTTKNLLNIRLFFDSLTNEVTQELKDQGRAVVLVGDGVNDGPAMATADVGVAMGGCGSAMAVVAADVVVLKDEPSAIARLLRLGRATVRLMKQNVVISVLLKVVVMCVALSGEAEVPLFVAVLVDVGSLLIVLLNSARLLGVVARDPAGESQEHEDGSASPHGSDNSL